MVNGGGWGTTVLGDTGFSGDLEVGEETEFEDCGVIGWIKRVVQVGGWKRWIFCLAGTGTLVGIHF